jgi:hypothetical protein
MFLVRAYPRESQEMVFDAHDRAFRLFGGMCRRGIYDNMATAVDTVFVGKERRFKAARRAAQLRVYAERVVVWCDGEIVGEHPRRFGRGQTAYDPWHYLPVLARKPGALRNGDPFRNWDLPPALVGPRSKLSTIESVRDVRTWLRRQSRAQPRLER